MKQGQPLDPDVQKSRRNNKDKKNNNKSIREMAEIIIVSGVFF
jgi:hypothetical protein